MKRFDITYFHGPAADYIVKPETVADIAASGITLVQLHYDTETNKKALPILARFGLRADVSDPRISRVIAANDVAGAEETVKAVLADYAPFTNILGWDLTDEPNTAAFPVLAALVAAFRRYDPERETVINLFPNYASPEALGAPDFRSYLERFIVTVHPHFISYDHYHFLGRQGRGAILSAECGERERLIRLSAEKTEDRGGFFRNIEDARELSLKYGLACMLIVLLTEHGPYRNLTRDEILWENNMCLAYGLRRLSYFTYWEPSPDPFWQWTNAMCDRKGNRSPHWYDVQTVNRALSDAGRYLFDKRSAAVFHLGAAEEGTTPFTAFGGITAAEGESGVLGFFDDGSVYLVNRDYQLERTFTLHAVSPMTVRKDGVFVPPEGNTDCRTLSVTLAPGHGVLLHI